MVYTPSGMFATADKMRLLFAECPTVQEVLEVKAVAEMTGWTRRSRNRDVRRSEFRVPAHPN